jgi:hypothetical protein
VGRVGRWAGSGWCACRLTALPPYLPYSPYLSYPPYLPYPPYLRYPPYLPYWLPRLGVFRVDDLSLLDVAVVSAVPARRTG